MSLLLIINSNCNAQQNMNKEEGKAKQVDSSQQQTANQIKFKVGQMWSYKTRPNEKDSYFIVVKIDANEKLGNIIHIALKNLKMKNPRSSGSYYESANHLPFAEKAISESAVELLKENAELPDYKEGYKMWKEAFDAHRAGIYTISIAKAVETMEATFNQ